MENNEVLNYIIKRYNINRKKLNSSKTSIADNNYSGIVIIELEKILKHFNIKIN